MGWRFGFIQFCALPVLLAWAQEGVEESRKKTKIDAATLVKATRNVDTDEEDVRSLSIRIEFPAQNWSVEAVWRAPDRIEFLLRDLSDGTPLAIQSGERLLTYDPLDGTLRLCEASRFELFLGYSDGEFEFLYSFSAPPIGEEEEPERPHRIRIGARDLLDATKPERKIHELGNGRPALVCTAPRSGNIFALEYDLERDWPCVGFLIQDPRSPHPDLEVRGFRVNEKVDDDRFREFDFESLEEHFVLNRVEMTAETEEKAQEAMTRLVRGIFIRTALTTPALRTQLADTLPPNLDWDAIAKSDSVLAPRLRALLPE